MKEPLVSICIPTYNQVHFLAKTLDSVCEQNFKDFEVIISDDSTTNEVEYLVSGYQARLNIKYHKNPKALGSPANWNRCLDLAVGRYIKFMHHDDWFSGPGSLSGFVEAVREHGDKEFIFCASEIINQSTGKKHINRAGLFFLRQLKKDPRFLFADNQVGAPSAVFYKRNDLRFDTNLRYLVDIDFYIRSLHTQQFYYLNEPLVVNTSGHEGQVTAASQDKETQLGEYSYLYHKYLNGRWPGFWISWFFIRLFRSYKVKSLDEVENVRNIKLEPAAYFKMLIRISGIRNRRKL